MSVVSRVIFYCLIVNSSELYLYHFMSCKGLSDCAWPNRQKSTLWTLTVFTNLFPMNTDGLWPHFKWVPGGYKDIWICVHVKGLFVSGQWCHSLTSLYCSLWPAVSLVQDGCQQGAGCDITSTVCTEQRSKYWTAATCGSNIMINIIYSNSQRLQSRQSRLHIRFSNCDCTWTKILVISEEPEQQFHREISQRDILCPRTVTRSEVLQSFSRAKAPVNHNVDSLSADRLTYILAAPNFWC